MGLPGQCGRFAGRDRRAASRDHRNGTPRWPLRWTTKFKAVDALLEQQRNGDGFKLYTELTPEQIKAFAEAVDALGEPISKVAEVVSK